MSSNSRTAPDTRAFPSSVSVSSRARPAPELLPPSPSSIKSRKQRPSSALDPPPYPEPAPVRKRKTSTTASASARSHTGTRVAAQPSVATMREYHAFSAADIKADTQSAWAHLDRATTTKTKSRRSVVTERETAYDTASESGASVLSAFRPTLDAGPTKLREGAREQIKASRRQTNSPLRKWARWMGKSDKSRWSIGVAVLLVLWVKWSVGMGSYSGAGQPPIRGDFEAQRHWISLTASSLPSTSFHATGSSLSVPLSEWYFHDLSYWGLDYPPLTAYHSLLLGAIARLSPRTAAFVELRPPTTASDSDLVAWESRMTGMEKKGDMKYWMRSTVVWGDLLVWISAVVVYCRANFAKGKGDKMLQTMAVATLSILLQPALILIDNGHFQYNSIMLGLTLWSLNFFQTNHDLLGAVAFVLSLGFKQMALYYSPAIFAYLLGKCLWLGGRAGLSLFINLGIVTLSTFALVFSPFLLSPTALFQAIHRIFPFARGLFEDKVANFWCALNIVIKLRDLASVSTLAKLALVATLGAVLPGVAGMLWVSWESGRRRKEAAVGGPEQTEDELAESTPPTLILLPHSLFVSSMAFFLFSFQVHEKSILLPLMPLTMLMGGREAGYGRMDWEWAVLTNNVGVFSMWPLLKRDGLGLEYVVLTLLWNFLIGYNPFELRRSFVKYLSLIAYATIAVLHVFEVVASPPAHLPDLFVVLNLTLSAIVFGLAFLWAVKRSLQEGWAVVGISMAPMSRKGASQTGGGIERRAPSGGLVAVAPAERRLANSSAGDPQPPSRVRARQH